MFLKLYLFNRVIVKVQWWVCCLIYFTRKIASCACLWGSGLKISFHWFAEAFTLFKSLLNLVTDKFISSATETTWRLLWDRLKDPLRKKCPYSELFWSTFSRIRTRITLNMDTFHVVIIYMDQKQQWTKIRSLQYVCFKVGSWRQFWTCLRTHRSSFKTVIKRFVDLMRNWQ